MGLDEAGRGPVLGDLFIGGVICSDKQIEFLKDNGVDDSKKLSSKKRDKFYDIIKQNCIDSRVNRISVKEIDENIKESGKKSLNDLEKEYFVKTIYQLKPDEVFIDAIGSKPEKFATEIRDMLKVLYKSEKIPKIIAKNKGDSLFTVVGAASILAKVQRDREIDKYKIEYSEFGNIGSGYTSDSKTIEFLKKYVKKNKKLPPIARKKWSTSKRIFEEIVSQKKLTDYF